MVAKRSSAAESGGDWYDRGLASYRGRVQKLADWCRELKLDYSRVHSRLHLGWSVEEAFSTERHVCRRTAVTIKGETKSVAAWCRQFKVPRWLYEYRISQGASPEGALNAKSKRRAKA